MLAEVRSIVRGSRYGALLLWVELPLELANEYFRLREMEIIVKEPGQGKAER